MKYAYKINGDGFSCSVVPIKDTDPIPEGLTQVPPGVPIGKPLYKVDGEITPTPPKALVVNEKLAELAEYRWTKSIETVSVEGIPLKAEDMDKIMLNFAALAGQPKVWKCADGIHRELTAQFLQLAAYTLNQRVQECFNIEGIIANRIKSAEYPETITISEAWEAEDA